MSKYEEYSRVRKEQQAAGLLPDWFTTGGFQMFSERYLFEAENAHQQYRRIARTAAKHVEGKDKKEWEDRFFNLLWKGWLSASTPALANMGTERGLPISCSGSYIPDSVFGFKDNELETCILTQEGFGTSGYLDDIRPRGSKISRGGKASGILPVYKDFVQAMRDIAQGTARRGAWAGYLSPEHDDFREILNFVKNNPDDANIGWIIRDTFIEALDKKIIEAVDRYQECLTVKMITGKGYFFFADKVNRMRPLTYVKHGLYVKASNLCSEIALFSDENHTFTCVLSSMNLAKYDEWKDTDAAYEATVFLDCVVSEFLERARNIRGLEKAVRFTEKGRALGLGACGFHTYLQDHMIPFDSIEAFEFNDEAFSRIRSEAERATQDMARWWGEPEWCEGFNRRNTHVMAIAPTKSTALIMGGISEGINPDPAMSYTQTTSAGEVDRVNPALLRIMKERGVYTPGHLKEITKAFGSVQGVDWLTEFEKLVFRTAYEIPQEAIIQLASARQVHIDQAQSINLFFFADASEEYISRIHQMAFNDPYIFSLYYCYSMAGVAAAQQNTTQPVICEACQ